MITLKNQQRLYGIIRKCSAFKNFIPFEMAISE